MYVYNVHHITVMYYCSVSNRYISVFIVLSKLTYKHHWGYAKDHKPWPATKDNENLYKSF